MLLHGKETYGIWRSSSSLKGNSKQQGDWGEIMLARTLEVAGLEEGRDFSLQETFDRQRPDAIIKLPDNRQIIVDAPLWPMPVRKEWQVDG